MWSFRGEEDVDACEPLAAAIYIGINAVSHPRELEPCPPIRAKWEDKATNQTPATTQAYLHNKMVRGTQHKSQKKQQN